MNKSVIVAGTAFLIFLSLVVYLFLHLLSSLPEEHRDKFTLPRTLDDARELRDVLMIYVETSYWSALFGVFVFYVFLQTFSIPGSIFLNVVAGAIFGLPVGLFATHTAACCGASLAFFLSSFIGRGIATAFFPQMLDRFQAKLDEHWNNLFNYLLFLRLTPFLPNWFINLASPILSVPYSKFLLATYLGIFPLQSFCIFCVFFSSSLLINNFS